MSDSFKEIDPDADEQGPDRASLVPRIKSLQFLAALQDLGIPEDQLPYTEPLAADLLVTYAFDLPGMFKMASVAAIAEVGIRPDEVRSVAFDNLKRQLRRVSSRERGPIHVLETGDDLEACTLLAGAFWNHVAAQMGSEVVVAVPSRDVVAYCSSDSSEGIAILREVSTDILQHAMEVSTHGLTDRLLVWRNGKWEEFPC